MQKHNSQTVDNNQNSEVILLGKQKNFPLPSLVEQVDCPLCKMNIRKKRSKEDRQWRLQCWENIGTINPIYFHGDCLKESSDKLRDIMNRAEGGWVI